jgi:hypothetical protein
MRTLTVEQAALVVGVTEPGQLARVRGRRSVVADLLHRAFALENGEEPQDLITVSLLEDERCAFGPEIAE